MSGEDLADRVRRYAALVWQRGLVEAAGGNVSARAPGAPTFLITGTGYSLREVPPGAVVEVDLAGRPADGGAGATPSKETGMHAAVYRNRPGAGAVIHCHPPYLVAYSSFGEPLPKPTVTALALLKHVPAVPTAWSGSERLHRAVDAALEEHPEAPAVILQHHGVIAFGRDLEEAFCRVDLVEKTARVWHLMRAVGGPPPDPEAIG